MKRWVGLVLPWYVAITSASGYSYTHLAYEGKDISVSCGNDADACEDIAKALNDAHEWRTQRQEPEDTNIQVDSAPEVVPESQAPMKLKDYPCPCGEYSAGNNCVCPNPAP